MAQLEIKLMLISNKMWNVSGKNNRNVHFLKAASKLQFNLTRTPFLDCFRVHSFLVTLCWFFEQKHFHVASVMHQNKGPIRTRFKDHYNSSVLWLHLCHPIFYIFKPPLVIGTLVMLTCKIVVRVLFDKEFMICMPNFCYMTNIPTLIYIEVK